MIAAVMATSYLPVLTPARIPVQGRICCLISKGAYLRRSAISSLSKPVGWPSLTNSKGRKSSSVATISPRFLISSMLPALAAPTSAGMVNSAAKRPSATRRGSELRQASEEVVMCVSLSLAKSIEAETVGAQIRRERRAFGLGGLSCLVLRPAIERSLAELRVGAVLLLGNGVDGVPPAVVIVDACGERTVVIAIGMRGNAARQAQADE